MNAKPSPIERHVAYATELVLAGNRPTVDLLVARLGGSRTTAQKALNEFWAERLPRLLAGRQCEDDMPPPVREAAAALWGEARRLADEAAAAALADEKRALAVRQAELDGALASIAEERRQAADRAAELEANAARHEQARRQAESERDAARQEALALREQCADYAARVEALEADLIAVQDEHRRAIAALRAAETAHAEERMALVRAHQAQMEQAQAGWREERAALQAAHAQALSELKEAYHASEQRLRVDLDAARTQATQATRAAEKAREALREAQGQVALLTEQVERARKARWRRPMLRRSLARPK